MKKKLVNEIYRIKEMMGILNEQIDTTHDKTYDYKKEGDTYYFRKKDSGESGWKKATGAGLEAIRTKIFGEKPKKSTTQPTTKKTSTVKYDEEDFFNPENYLNTTMPRSTSRVETKPLINIIKEPPKLPFKDKTEGNKFRNWVNDKYPAYAKEIDLSRSGSYNNEYIKKAWGRYGQEYLDKVLSNKVREKMTFKQAIEKGMVGVPKTVPGADRINKELLFINNRSEYNGKPFFIVDPRLNLVLAFDSRHNLVDYSQSVASADKQQDKLFTRKEWCELSTYTKNPKRYGYGKRTYENVNGYDVCVRTHEGKRYTDVSVAADSDDTLEQANVYAYDVLATEHKRYAQKGIYGIDYRKYEKGFEGKKGIDNVFGLSKDGVSVGTAIHALVPIPGRIEADDELKGLLKKDLNSGTIPSEYVNMVEKDFLRGGSKYDLSAGCFNVDPKFIQNPEVQTISKFPGVPVFIMGEQDTDYLVQVEPGKEGEFMLDLGGKGGSCISPSSLENQYGIEIDSGIA